MSTPIVTSNLFVVTSVYATDLSVPGVCVLDSNTIGLSKRAKVNGSDW